MDLVLDNRCLVFEAPRPLFELFDRRTAFYVKGFFHVEAFKQGFWDGKEHLVKRYKPRNRAFQGWYTCASGLLGELLRCAKSLDLTFEIRDERRKVGDARIVTDWNPEKVLRPYQERAKAAVLADRGLETGKALLDMATRSGKTVVAASIIDELKLPTLFLVQSEMLLRQTLDAFRNILRCPVGRIGSGVWDPAPITVASIQTLTRRVGREEYRDEVIALLDSFDLVFFDEVHHVQGEVWRDLLMNIDAPWKIGLSATIFLHRKKENPKGTIWIYAALGPVVEQVTPTELINGGWLIPPRVVMHKITGPKVNSSEWPVIYNDGVVNHHVRNAKIVEVARARHAAGLSIVVVVARHEHVELLCREFRAVGLRAEAIIGPTSVRERRRLVKAFVGRKIDALIGTVIGEGVDIPSIESVIVAEAGESAVRATQRFRNITPAPGKETAILDDFADLHNHVLSKHSLARMKTYRSHAGFRVEVDDGSSTP